MASTRNAADDASTLDMEGTTVVMLPMSMQSDFVTIIVPATHLCMGIDDRAKFGINNYQMLSFIYYMQHRSVIIILACHLEYLFRTECRTTQSNRT